MLLCSSLNRCHHVWMLYLVYVLTRLVQTTRNLNLGNSLFHLKLLQTRLGMVTNVTTLNFWIEE